MKPVDFKGHNVVFAKDQPEYQPLPAYKTGEGEVITQWKFSLKEKIKILFGKPLWLRQLTFNQPLQPQLPTLENPFKL